VENKKLYNRLEVLCVFFWFLLDGFWLMEWQTLTYVFSALALATGLLMLKYVERKTVVILVTGADLSWLIVNIMWAIGDLGHRHDFITLAKWGFLVGGLFCAAAISCSDAHQAITLSRIRILNLFRGRTSS
jgi:hypothetical protein